jgi:TonB family protein
VPSGPAQADSPIEIVFKPTPEYSAEARALRIEGDVVLDVEFRATSEIRVLGVARGLGHGLDEEAVRAALRIRFKPARSASGPIAIRTTVHILFRLS